MVEFLTTKGTAAEIENIIRNANKWLVVISPYVNLSANFLERLQDADRRNVAIFIVCKEGALELGERNKLQQLKLKNLSLMSHKDLHAKSYVNEDCLVITSMNIYQYSEKNREMGILIRKSEDERVFLEAAKEVDSIIHSSTKDDLMVTKDKHAFPSHRNEPAGYCIRCRTPIPLDLYMMS